MSTDIVAVVGASDPEQEYIRLLLGSVGIPVHQAMHGGKPVHPGTAYRSDDVDPHLPPDGIVWRIECDGPAISGRDVVVIDHHRPGDPGYGRPPEEFLAASSIGQVISHLARVDRCPRDWPRVHSLVGLSDIVWEDGEYVVGDGYDTASVIPADIVLAAAADHCLESAYRGRCPGVGPDSLMRWRAQSRASFQRRSVSDVLADIESARLVLRQALELGRGDVADLRGRHVPELPEAAARDGIPFIASVRERDGRDKVVLQAATPDLVERFIAGDRSG